MSTTATKPALWHGIARDTIPWFANEVRALIRKNQLVLASESRVSAQA